jgi:hypothetical protein
MHIGRFLALAALAASFTAVADDEGFTSYLAVAKTA